MTDKQVMQQALEALEDERYVNKYTHIVDAIIALRKALEQPEQGPVALEAVYETIIQWDEGGGKRSRRELARRIVDIYTTPPAAQRPWQGLTDEDLEFWTKELGQGELGRGVIRAVADHLKERNT